MKKIGGRKRGKKKTRKEKFNILLSGRKKINRSGREKISNYMLYHEQAYI